MKYLFILATLCLLIACKKDSSRTSSIIMITAETETSAPQARSAQQAQCTVSDGSGSYAGHRNWNFVFLDKAWEISLLFPGDFLDDNIRIDSTFSFEYRKSGVGAKFWCNYGEGNTLTHIGSDSAFFHIRISSYNGSLISGIFDFKTYDPGEQAYISNGSFSNVPVTKK